MTPPDARDNAGVPLDTAPREMTVKAVALGVFLALVFGAANAYLGMRAGQTVAATLPAAVIAMALFRIPAFRGGVLEQNIARTAASVGEALVAGAIFTIPAFVMVEVNGARLWTDLRSHYWDATMILLCGGLLGVFFIILLRRALVVDAGLPWPESVAAASIVKASGERSDAPRLIFGSMAFAGLVQFLKSDKGLLLFREYTEGFWAFPRAVVNHFNFAKEPIGAVTHGGGIPWTTPALSPALIGIGYIIGPKYAFVNAAGGVLAWWVLIPLLLFFDPDLPRRMTAGGEAGSDVLAYTLWFNIVRPIAVGMMLVAAVNTLVSMRTSLVESLRGAFALRGAGTTGTRERTEHDLPMKWILLSMVGLLIATALTYIHFTGNVAAALVAAVAMTFTGFLLCAVGGYLCGLVGASNQPLSGLTLSALILSALLLTAFGVQGAPGMIAVLGVAAVVATAVSVSGSLIQDFKAGHLLGGTPWKMQLVEIITVALLAFFLMAPVILLHEANLATGGIGGRALPAPQAGLMAQLAKGIVGGEMAWGLLAMGAAFGIALLFTGARSPMLIAVGMYLPFDTSSAIAVGGAIKWVVERLVASRSEEERVAVEDRGSFVASGLIAGEAIMGIVLAATFLGGIPSFTRLLVGADEFGFYAQWGGALSLLGFAAIALLLIRTPLRPQLS
jgi:putative OPT family oligopeptide transporter